MVFNKLLKNRPKPNEPTPEQVYLAGRASADLDAYRKVVPPTMDPSVKCGDGAAACPYKFDDAAVKSERLNWLIGFYAEIADQSELKCRKALGLKPINWDPPIEQKTEQGRRKG